MRARGMIQSPVLVGRDAYLALVEARLAGAAAGGCPAVWGAAAKLSSFAVGLRAQGADNPHRYD